MPHSDLHGSNVISLLLEVSTRAAHTFVMEGKSLCVVNRIQMPEAGRKVFGGGNLSWCPTCLEPAVSSSKPDTAPQLPHLWEGHRRDKLEKKQA